MHTASKNLSSNNLPQVVYREPEFEILRYCTSLNSEVETLVARGHE